MAAFLQLKDKTYETDGDDFLENPYTWDETFAEEMADRVNISGGLTASHWGVIYFIRNTFMETGRCPGVYQTLRNLKLRTKDLKRLFPTGYLRGACKLAGLTYRAQHIHPLWLEKTGVDKIPDFSEKRVYRVDAYGFLVDPSEWDEDFALCKSEELKMPESLTHEHWKIIRFLRRRFQETGSIPTVYATCEDNGIEIEDLERLFPDGYHRGAVKVSGLRIIS
ncbi:MAG: TusE/DsrC/DsvC family sulfur relay protein [Syntrophobacteraceae bacterium]|jgi:tRNA 2-thiouridine synthesizing protein E